MTVESVAPAKAGNGAGAWSLGWRVYGVGVVGVALVGLAMKDFLPGQSVPKGFPDRMVLAYAANGLLLVAGLALEWRRIAAWAAGALTAYYLLIVVALENGRVVLRHAGEYGAYSGAAEQLAVAAGGLVVVAQLGRLAPARAARLARVGQGVFGACAVLFGGAHFAYMNLTAPLVPAWLPPSQLFWGYATGVFQIAGGLALIAGVRARLAAILLAAMYAAFTPLVHLPIVLADPSKLYPWSELALNVLLTGCAWAVADSLSPPRNGEGQAA